MDILNSNKVDNKNNEMKCEKSASQMDYLHNLNKRYCSNHINNNVDLSHSASMPEYNGGSLVKWRVSALRQEGEQNRHSSVFRNSLHWEEFFGKLKNLYLIILYCKEQRQWRWANYKFSQH